MHSLLSWCPQSPSLLTNHVAVLTKRTENVSCGSASLFFCRDRFDVFPRDPQLPGPDAGRAGHPVGAHVCHCHVVSQKIPAQGVQEEPVRCSPRGKLPRGDVWDEPRNVRTLKPWNVTVWSLLRVSVLPQEASSAVTSQGKNRPVQSS